MKKSLCLVLAALFIASLMPLIASTAKAENATTTWGAIKSAGTAEAAPPAGPLGLARRIFVHYPRGKGNNRGKPPKPPKSPDGECGTDQYEEYKYTRIHWDRADLPVPWYYDDTDEEAEGALAAIQDSFATWTAAEPKWITEYLDGADIPGTPIGVMDYFNTFCWRNIPEELGASYSNAIAITAMWYYRRSKALVEVDTYMGTQWKWAVNAPSVGGYQMDIQNIATHEIGHWLNLGDLYSECDRELTMYGSSDHEEDKKRSLGRGDILGIQRIY